MMERSTQPAIGADEAAAVRGPLQAEGGRPERRVLSEWTVIIPTLGRPILERCLQALASGTALPGHIVVVDQGKNTEAVESWVAPLKEHGMQAMHIVSAEKGPALARNRALEHVDSDRVAAVDDDCLPDQHWLEVMNRVLDQHPDYIITGRVDPGGEGLAPTVKSEDQPVLFRSPSASRPSPLASGNMAFAMKTARRIGPLDTELLTAEDNDWAYRALRLGVPILYTPDAVVQHYHWRSDAELAKTYMEYAWGQGNFYGKHLRRGDLLMLSMASVSLFRGARTLLAGWLSHDFGLRSEGSARLRRMVPGMIHGFLRSRRKP